MLANEIRLNIEYLDKYKCRIEINKNVLVKDLVISLTKLFLTDYTQLFETDYQEQYTLVDKENERYLQKEQSLADQQVQDEAVLQLEIAKVDIIVTDTISGNQAILSVMADFTADEILKAALEEPNLTQREKKIDFKLKQEGENENSMSRIIAIRENSRYLLIENKKIKVRLRKKADIDFEKEIKEVLNSRSKIKKKGFSTCKTCGYNWVVEKCHKCGEDQTHWLETEQEFELRKANALKEIYHKKAAYNFNFVDVEVPLSAKGDDLSHIFQEAYPECFHTHIDKDYNSNFYRANIVELTCLESKKRIWHETDLYDAGVEEGNTIEVEIGFRSYDRRTGLRAGFIPKLDLRDHRYYKQVLVSFWEWFKSSYPELNLFVSVPYKGLDPRTYYLYGGGKGIPNIPSWYGSSSKGKGIGNWINSLEELNNRMKSETGVTKETPDQELIVMLPDYEKYASINMNGLFLFLEVQTKPSAFEKIYWRKIGALTKEYLDIHYCLADAVEKIGDEFATEIDYLHTLNLTFPCLVLWEKDKDLSTMVVVDFSGVTEEVMYDCFELSVQASRENMNLYQMAGHISSETRKSFNSEAPQIRYLERRSLRNKE